MSALPGAVALALLLAAGAGALPCAAAHAAEDPAPPVAATADSADAEPAIDELADPTSDEEPEPGPVPPAPAKPRRLEPLVPALADHPYRMSPGPRAYLHRLAFSPGFGALGDERQFLFRLAYYPNAWLGYEGSLNHNPAQSVHAVLHSLSAVVRRPVPGRFQPYLAAGYGMYMVFPGRSLNADPVTKNAVSAGGGLEIFIRDDLALRGEMRRATVFGREKDREGVVTYDYLEQSIGLVFYRSVAP